jgi:Uma2 family endonuclease
MAEVGLLPPDARVELIDGDILYMSPQKTPHFNAVSRGHRVLSLLFGEGYWVRSQGPLSLALEVEPEPDLAVVPGSEDDYEDSHPSTAVLIAEVSDTTLRFDQTNKAALYARAGIQEYWIVDLVHGKLEVRRDPEATPGGGYRYGTLEVLERGDTVSPLGTPSKTIAVADLLPKAKKDKKR